MLMMNLQMTRLLAILILALGLNACDKEEAVPSYIFIEDIDLQTSPEQGSASSDFRVVGLLSGTEDFGQFYLPAQIPILKEGLVTLDIFPGINDNGIAATPLQYDLLKPISIEVELAPMQVDTLNLTATYKDILEFVFVEEFESENQIFREDLDGDSSTEVVLTEADVFEGNRSGSLVVNDEHPVLFVGSTFYQSLPPRAVPVYLEINYKSDVTLEIGLSWLSTTGGLESAFQNAISPKDEWGKIYINFSEQLNILNNIAGIQAWQIMLRVNMPTENGTIVTGSREVLLDNFKLIHYK